MPRIRMPMPSQTSICPKRLGAAAALMTSEAFSFWKNWKMVKPKLMREMDVRITDIKVRSALRRVRWKDMPVRRAESSTEGSSRGDFRAGGADRSSAMILHLPGGKDARDEPCKRRTCWGGGARAVNRRGRAPRVHKGRISWFS